MELSKHSGRAARDTYEVGEDRAVAPPSADMDVVPWFVQGAVAGVLGAVTIAAFFLVIDLFVRTPLWTPTALGSALFRGLPIAPDASPEPVLVLAYTALHGLVFMALGLLAAIEVTSRPLFTRSGGLLALAVTLFVAMEAGFVGFALLAGSAFLWNLGLGLVTIANLLGAAVMALYLRRWVRLEGALGRLRRGR